MTGIGGDDKKNKQTNQPTTLPKGTLYYVLLVLGRPFFNTSRLKPLTVAGGSNGQHAYHHLNAS